MSMTQEQVRPRFFDKYSEAQINELIERYIEAEAFGSGVVGSRIRGRGTTVAAVIDHLEAVDGDVAQAADAYDLDLDQSLAAVFYYFRYQEIVDAEITVRRSYFMES